MTIRYLKLTYLGVLILLTYGAAPDPAKVNEGDALFQRRCTGCHGLDQVRVGPRLRNVYGSIAGSDANFNYSGALKSSKVKWDETALDKWLSDTESLVPGNDMAFRVANPEERSAIIAYLRTISGK